MFAEESIFNLL